MSILGWLIIGLIAGAIARFVVPGSDPLGLLGTLLLGLVGSFVGGFLAVVFTDRTLDEFSASGLLGSILGAIVALLAYRYLQSRGGMTGRRGTRV